MPIVESTYRPPLFFKNRHRQTLYRALFRKVPEVVYQRERITTPDDDFIDLDWSTTDGSDRLLIGMHGLEGSSESTYLKGLIKYANQSGWDGVALNFRSCSGEPNLKLRSYHSGETEDIDFVLNYAISKGYQQIAIVGFSLGGNVALKYSGEQGNQMNPAVVATVGVSVPCHLQSCSEQLDKWYNQLYLSNFMTSLKQKVEDKIHLLDERVDINKIRTAKTFADFDGAFTAPVHGFASAVDYWTRCSSLHFVDRIETPALLINAADDSFLSERCFPKAAAMTNPHFHLEIPDSGGHVGFVSFTSDKTYWIERRIMSFIKTQL